MIIEVAQPVMGVVKVRAARDAEKNLHQPMLLVGLFDEITSPIVVNCST